VLCPEGAQTRPNTRAFLDWLASEVTRMDDHRAGRRMVDAGMPEE
jgi:LysR family glycine cleavage system transcriptional activator